MLQSQRDSSFEAQNFAAELKVRAERKLGEITRDMPKNEGSKGQLIGPGIIGSNNVLPPIDTPTYSELGLDKMAVSRWQAIASVPEERFTDQA